MVQWSRLDKAVVARGRPNMGFWLKPFSIGTTKASIGFSPTRLSCTAGCRWCAGQWALPAVLGDEARSYGPERLMFTSKQQDTAVVQKSIISDPHLQKTVGVFSDRIVALDCCRSGHITTLGKSSHSRTYRVSWVCWHGPKKSGKMAQPALEGLKCNSVSRSCRSCHKSHVWSLEFSLLWLARKIRRQTIMTWGSICLVDGDWLCFFSVPDEQLCVCNVFSVLNHILG